MRRSDREITDKEEMTAVLKKCDVCRLAFCDGEYPYIIPLNFGMSLSDGMPVLYFHGAKEGKKLELIRQNGRASFEADCSHRLVFNDQKKSCTMEYESVIGCGRVEMVADEEKHDALCRIMEHYYDEPMPFDDAVVPRTAVFKLTVEHMTGKRRTTVSK